MNYEYILFLIFPLAFCIALLVNRQSLVPGALFILNILNAGIFLYFLVVKNRALIQENTIISLVTIFFTIVIILALVIFPVFFLVNFIVNGIQAIKREGFKLSNLLSIILSLATVLYFLMWPKLGRDFTNSLSSIFYNFLGIILLYFLFVGSSYFFASMLNNYKPRELEADYIVVLGSGLMGDKITPLLKGRLDVALEAYNFNKSAKIITSGGKGPDEEISEGQAMASYLMEQGVEKNNIVIEDKSRSTRQNILYSRRLMKGRSPKIIIASNSYHIFRALLIANDLNISAKGVGSKTKSYFAINAFIREIVGYISLTKKHHLIVLSILLAVFLLYILINIAYQTGGLI